MLRCLGALAGRVALSSGSSVHGARAFSAAAAAAVQHKVGFIGLGRMGSRMVNNLLASGVTVVAHDINRLAMSRAREVAKTLPQGTLEERGSPADIAADPEVPVVITMLSSAADAKEVFLGRQGLFKVPGGPASRLFIDCTTVDPPTTRQLAAAAGMLRLAPSSRPVPGLVDDGKPHLIDAPVTGAVVGAEAGTLTFMVGGNRSAADAAMPLLRSMGSAVIYVGGHGAGLAAKMCNMAVVAASMAAVAEALAAGKRLGIDPALLTQVLNSGAARCWSSDTYNPAPGALPAAISSSLPASRGYRGAGMPTRDVVAQLRMLADAAGTARSPVPLTRYLAGLYERVEAEGLGDKDFSSIYRYVYGSGCDNSEWREGDQLFSSQAP